MDISRQCKVRDLNWALLPDLVARLVRSGWTVKRASVGIRRYPDTLTFDSIEDAVANVRRDGAPRRYSIDLSGTPKALRLRRDRNIHDQEFLVLSMEGINDPSEVDNVMEFLALAPDEPLTLPPDAPRTAFVAHKFDEAGTQAADKLARFLELFGFDVETGRGYSPGPISDKVRARIESQAALFAILTPGNDNTWLTQESVIAEIRGKPLFVLKEKSAQFKPGMLADHEFIPFENSKIETTFISVLEGLRELGYLEFDD
jgi:hypothetical protein